MLINAYLNLTLLIKYTGYNRLKIVQILLQHGASVSSKDKG